jgi:hypothetical protein
MWSWDKHFKDNSYKSQIYQILKYRTLFVPNTTITDLQISQIIGCSERWVQEVRKFLVNVLKIFSHVRQLVKKVTRWVYLVIKKLTHKEEKENRLTVSFVQREDLIKNKVSTDPPDNSNSTDWNERLVEWSLD